MKIIICKPKKNIIAYLSLLLYHFSCLFDNIYKTKKKIKSISKLYFLLKTPKIYVKCEALCTYIITFLIIFVNKKEIEIKLIISTSMNKNEKLKKNNIKKIKNQKSLLLYHFLFFCQYFWHKLIDLN